ncbi:N-glycosylase/DNA lyase isoform X1 [Stomoxys calcitrans]|uniref:N-glycosylase/DNA lyase isoform X1 n=1 Tax=Stomoxys calcitrans TaxID=35570 RepID=UPI0027E321F2|nr:N-glycosylase/DNA lyase isoform X1 [Stomoxys calcitrans]XP_059222968.1 N-glycosylase/DNA lyase isoform X1 [Stomoxys calcitrans]
MLELQGSIAVNENELNLDLTLLGGQSFRWEKLQITDNENLWKGVACNAYWELKQDTKNLHYKVYSEPLSTKHDNVFYENLLKRYFRLDFNLNKNVTQWRKSHPHFHEISGNLKAVRVLDQEPLENILSFICSQNNNIKRISTMINWLCSNYGNKIGNFHSKDEYSFPTLESLIKHQNELESRLRSAKFGYRAKFIAQSVMKINEFGGYDWFEKLRTLPYNEARIELAKVPGIGFKVADCICLMSLNHLESVPIDTHIFKIAQSVYMPQLRAVKAVTPKIYEEIAEKFRQIYGAYAGWTQAVLFCSELRQFQTDQQTEKSPTKPKKKRNK